MKMLRIILKMMLKTALVLSALLITVFYFVFFSPRPPLSIDPATLVGDGSQINYCQLPVLDGNGKMAKDIAKGNTPGCSFASYPRIKKHPSLGADATSFLRKTDRPVRPLGTLKRMEMSN